MATRTHNRTKSPKGSGNRKTTDAKIIKTEGTVQNDNVNVDERKKADNNKWDKTQTAKEALELVTENESVINGQTANDKNRNSKYKGGKRINWDEFIHLSLTWFVSAFAIAIVLVILSLEEQSTDLFHDVINRIDTLSLMFSLVLSAALEQIWNHKNNKMFQYTLAGELILVILGLVWYLVCSIHEIQLRTPNFTGTINQVYIERFKVHIVYIFLSVCCVLVGFLSRVSMEQEEY